MKAERSRCLCPYTRKESLYSFSTGGSKCFPLCELNFFFKQESIWKFRKKSALDSVYSLLQLSIYQQLRSEKATFVLVGHPSPVQTSLLTKQVDKEQVALPIGSLKASCWNHISGPKFLCRYCPVVLLPHVLTFAQIASLHSPMFYLPHPLVPYEQVRRLHFVLRR